MHSVSTPQPAAVVVPWCDRRQIELFCQAWGVEYSNLRPEWLVLQHDVARRGCAVTKNAGVLEAVNRGYETVVVLDDDCYPAEPHQTLSDLAAAHVRALRPQPVELFAAVTDPPSRGTPYGDRTMLMPVAASMGFWSQVGDYCAVRQLAFRGAEMRFNHEAVFGRYFPLCGMNLAFRPGDWEPWCRFVDVPRFDDIWMGWLWQKEAYRRQHCFSLAGPTVRHSRQSDPWRNLEVEVRHLKANETLWKAIAAAPSGEYATLRALLPTDQGGSDR